MYLHNVREVCFKENRDEHGQCDCLKMALFVVTVILLIVLLFVSGFLNFRIFSSLVHKLFKYSSVQIYINI